MRSSARNLLCVLTVSLIAGCGGVRVQPGADLHGLEAVEGYRLLVKAQDASLDPVLYDLAMRELGAVLPLKETGDGGGSVEVLFASREATTQLWGTIGIGTGWYGGPITPRPSTHVGVGVGSSGSRSYLNATLRVTVKDGTGRGLWQSEVAFNGRWSLEESAEGVAQRCLERAARRLRRDLARLSG
jgi:hypothetical protein